MEILQPGLLPEHITDTKTRALYLQFRKLLDEAGKKKIPDHTVKMIHQQTELIPAELTDKAFYRCLKEKQKAVLALLEKEHKIVPKNYYRNMWIAAGLAVFGLPLGAAFGLAMGNTGLLGIGFPIGLTIGVAVGTSLDKKAEKEGRQLDLEIKY